MKTTTIIIQDSETGNSVKNSFTEEFIDDLQRFHDMDGIRFIYNELIERLEDQNQAQKNLYNTSEIKENNE